MRRRPAWPMNVIEAGQHDTLINGHAVSRGLDHEYDRIVIYRQYVSAVAIGSHHLATVRYQHIGNSRIARLALAATRQILKHHPGHHGLMTIKRTDFSG